VCFDTQGKSVDFEYLKTNIFSRATLLVIIHVPGPILHLWCALKKLALQLKKEGPPLSTVRYGDINQTGLLLP
jgi:hypothetical protein